MNTNYGALRKAIERRLKAKGPEWAFTPSDFADLAEPRTLGKEFTRLVRAGRIRRAQRGVYECMREHPLLGQVGAGPDAVLEAVARRDGLKLLPSGAHAANLLGLSTQVAARQTYGVQGRSRRVGLAGSSANGIELKRRSSRTMMLAGRASGWVAEALRNLGREHVTPERLAPLRARLTAKDKKQLRDDLRYVPAWMRPHFLTLSLDA